MTNSHIPTKEERLSRVQNNPAIQQLGKSPHWCCYKLIPEEGTKAFCPQGPAYRENPDTHLSLSQAKELFLTGRFDGLAFLPCKRSRVIPVQLPYCLNSNKVPNEAAREIVELLGSYTQVDVIGCGLVILILADRPVLVPTSFVFKQQPVYIAAPHIPITAGVIEEFSTKVSERTKELHQLIRLSLPLTDSHSPGIMGLRGAMLPVIEMDSEVLLKTARALDPILAGLLDSTSCDGNKEKQQTDLLAVTKHLVSFTRNPKQIAEIILSSKLCSKQSVRERFERIKEDIIEDAILLADPELNEFGLLARVIQHNAGTLFYCVEQDSFYCYSNGTWDSAPMAEMERIIAAVTSFRVDAAYSSDEERRNELLSFAKRNSVEKSVKATANLCKGVTVLRTSITAFDDFETTKSLLNTPNGVVNLRTGDLSPHDAALKITKQTSVPYDPNATCDLWTAKMREACLGDEALYRYLHRFFGYCATGEMREKIIAIIWGPTNCGKSTYLEAIKYPLGKGYTQSAPTSLLMRGQRGAVPNDLARTCGARVVEISEWSENSLLDTAKAKQMSGGDEMAARFLRQEFFSFKPQAKIIINTNFKPIISENDDAIWDRMRVIPFLNQVPAEKRDKQLLEKLQAEAEGILAWVVRGAVAYYEEGLGTCKAVEQATALYKQEMCSVEAFLDECCDVIPEKLRPMSRSELFNLHHDGSPQHQWFRGKVGKDFVRSANEMQAAYKTYCNDGGIYPLRSQDFSSQLALRKFRRERTSEGHFYTGLKLNQNWESRMCRNKNSW